MVKLVKGFYPSGSGKRKCKTSVFLFSAEEGWKAFITFHHCTIQGGPCPSHPRQFAWQRARLVEQCACLGRVGRVAHQSPLHPAFYSPIIVRFSAPDRK